MPPQFLMREEKFDSSPEQDAHQRLLNEFGFGEEIKREDDQCYGAGRHANSVLHTDIRQEIKRSIQAFDEQALSMAIDQAHKLGEAYPFKDELVVAEERLYELTECWTML